MVLIGPRRSWASAGAIRSSASRSAAEAAGNAAAEEAEVRSFWLMVTRLNPISNAIICRSQGGGAGLNCAGIEKQTSCRSRGRVPMGVVVWRTLAPSGGGRWGELQPAAFARDPGGAPPFRRQAQDLALAVGKRVGLGPGLGRQLRIDHLEPLVRAADRLREPFDRGVLQ